jgi:hypothetical protein
MTWGTCLAGQMAEIRKRLELESYFIGSGGKFKSVVRHYPTAK